MSANKLSYNINDTDAVIGDKLDLLFEKRKAVRSSALTALHTTLSLRYCGESLESRLETLATGLERVMRDLQEEPTYLALRTACLASLSMPAGYHTFFAKLREPVQRIIANGSLPSNVRAEAVSTLATLCFMSGLIDVEHESSITSEVLNLFCGFLFIDGRQYTTDFLRAALQGCMLLASTMPTSIIHTDLYQKYFNQVVDMMNEEHDITVRITAAKAATLFIEWEKDHLKSGDGGTEIEDLSVVLDKLYAVLDDKSKFNGKADLKKQRKTLKSLVAYLEGEPVQEETIQVKAFPLVLQTWAQIFRMERFRGYLGEGFMTHLEENKTLMYIFDYYVDAKAPIIPTMTKQQRRFSLSQEAKVQSKRRGSLRAIREENTVGYATE